MPFNPRLFATDAGGATMRPTAPADPGPSPCRGCANIAGDKTECAPFCKALLGWQGGRLDYGSLPRAFDTGRPGGNGQIGRRAGAQGNGPVPERRESDPPEASVREISGKVGSNPTPVKITKEFLMALAREIGLKG